MVTQTVSTFRTGDQVIYRMTKHSDSPGPRARNVNPSPSGEDYNYIVDKFWVVNEVLDNGRLILRTRRGKTREIAADDPNLKVPSWWQMLLYKKQFPASKDS